MVNNVEEPESIRGDLEVASQVLVLVKRQKETGLLNRQHQAVIVNQQVDSVETTHCEQPMPYMGAVQIICCRQQLDFWRP